ncbi:MAG: hypothetical protein AB7T31_17395 [Gemmatimonadales bacterium]
MSRTRSVVWVVAVSTFVCAAPGAASAQTIVWRETSTLGYGMTAGSLALAACWSGCELESAGIFIISAGIAGMVIGNRIGASAERAAREGRMTAGQRWRARFGMVTGVAATGTLLAVWWIEGQSGNAPGEDERRLRDWTLIGAGAGVAAEILQERALGEGYMLGSARPFVGRSPAGGLALGLRVGAPTW